MKIFGDLKNGDVFYIINWYDDNIIDSVEKHIVSSIVDAGRGKCVKWIDEYGKMLGTTVTYEECNLPLCKTAYLTSICSDKKIIQEVIEQSLDKYKEMSNKNLEVLNENKS